MDIEPKYKVGDEVYILIEIPIKCPHCGCKDAKFKVKIEKVKIIGVEFKGVMPVYNLSKYFIRNEYAVYSTLYRARKVKEFRLHNTTLYSK